MQPEILQPEQDLNIYHSSFLAPDILVSPGFKECVFLCKEKTPNVLNVILPCLSLASFQQEILQANTKQGKTGYLFG